MGSWRCGLCIGGGGRGWGEGEGEGWAAESQLFVLNGKNVLVNVYQNVNYFVRLQSPRRSNRILLVLMYFFCIKCKHFVPKSKYFSAVKCCFHVLSRIRIVRAWICVSNCSICLCKVILKKDINYNCPLLLAKDTTT